MRTGIDITGNVYGRLTAIEQVENPKGTRPLWLCVCVCGTTKNVLHNNLKHNLVKSCGCLNAEVRVSSKTTHGLSKHKLFKTWEGLVSRCTNTSNKDYTAYGGRGITVSASWLESPQNFFDDMGDRPEGSTLERIKNNLGYSKDNCRWANSFEQGANKRNNNVGTVEGETVHLAGAARSHNIPESTIRNRLALGMALEEAVNTPVRVKTPFLTVALVSRPFGDWAEIAGVSLSTIRNRLKAGLTVEQAVFGKDTKIGRQTAVIGTEQEE